MVATPIETPLRKTHAEESIIRLKELTNKLTIAIQELKARLESLPDKSKIEDFVVNLGEKHATRTLDLLNKVPKNTDGLLTAINLVQTYLQVTEFLTQTFLTGFSRFYRGSDSAAIVRPLVEARQALDAELIKVLGDLEKLPPTVPITIPGTGNAKVDELIQKTNAIVDIINDPNRPASEKVTKFIQYLEQDAEPILKSDGFALTEAQISLLIKQWGVVMEKLPSVIPATEEERKRTVTQFLRIRRLLENNYDLLAEILRIKDPLGFRTP